MVTPRSSAIAASVSAIWPAMDARSTLLSGRRCRFCSIRDRDSRSSTRRDIRRTCSPMMPRKRSCAAGSLRAGPCRVSTKPSNDASGVRNSWLALATKSTRIRSMRRVSVVSRKVTSRASGISRPSGATWTSNCLSTGTRVSQFRVAWRSCRAARRASKISGARTVRETGSPSRIPGNSDRAGLFAQSRRQSPSRAKAASGRASTQRARIVTASVMADTGQAVTRRRPLCRRDGSSPRATASSGECSHLRRAVPARARRA